MSSNRSLSPLRESGYPPEQVRAWVRVYGEAFPRTLRERKIKFRPNRPRSPHLNGKVERSQQTDRVEFWATVDNSQPVEILVQSLSEWRDYYNLTRGHSSSGGKTP